MIICLSRGFVFIHIHKAGGTSMEAALEPRLQWNDLLLGSTRFGQIIDGHYRQRFGLSKHSALADVERVCGADLLRGMYAFALVRHPAARICSLYNFTARVLDTWSRSHGIPVEEARARRAELAPAHEQLRWETSRAFLETEDFGGFLRHPATRKSIACRTQLSRLRGASGTAEAFRLEEIEQRLPEIGGRLGCDIVLPHLNVTERKLVTPAALPEPDRAVIRDWFREDFEAFGYD
ncbi:sulfotransferase family 2 domain-containing protein [Falsiroseomonas sp.]|uniref:sulfotransferase family 2 domain-containing protein n=1 Tax=Falsiroseomonas sp. TaxID=2870721 RepID=UPI003562FAA9